MASQYFFNASDTILLFLLYNALVDAVSSYMSSTKCSISLLSILVTYGKN